MNDVQAGKRCRLTRSVLHGQGEYRRGTEAIVRSIRENEGRTLVTVTPDSGTKNIVLFLHEVEPVATEEA